VQLSLEEMASAVSSANIPVQGAHTADELLHLLETELDGNDCILLSSSGAMGGLIEAIPRLAEEKFPK